MNGTKTTQLKPRRKFRFTSDDRWGYIFIAAAMIRIIATTTIISISVNALFIKKPHPAKW